MSNPWHLPTVLHYALALQPARVLDVGVGMGAYGFMLRQFTDISAERISKPDWRLVMDGVEIFEPYANPVWDYAYDQVLRGDIRKLIPSLGKYDLILCGDVLEHFPKEESAALMRRLLELGKVLIATTPVGDYPQGAWGGNEAEAHLCTLAASDFPHLIARKITGVTGCYVCSTDSASIAVIQRASRSCPEVRTPFLASLKSWLRRWAKRLGRGSTRPHELPERKDAAV